MDIISNIVGVLSLYDKRIYSTQHINTLLNLLKGYCTVVNLVTNIADVPKEIAQHCDSILYYKDKKTSFEYAYQNIPHNIEHDRIIFMDTRLIGPLYNMNDTLDWIIQEDIGCCGLSPDSLKYFLILKKELADDYFKGKIDAHYLYVDDTVLQLTDKPFFVMPYTMVKQFRCPFICIDIISHDYTENFKYSMGMEIRKVYDFIMSNNLYDQDVFWELICKSTHQIDIVNNLNFNFILPKDIELTDNNLSASKKKYALILHMYYMDLAESVKDYLRNLPEFFDVYVTTDSYEKIDSLKISFADLSVNKLEYILCENRGRDVSVLLVAAKDVVENYDLVCFVHDKKSNQNKLASISYDFYNKCIENTIGSREYINNILNLFNKHPKLGILSPLPPHHGEYFFILGFSWAINYKITKRLFNNLKLDTPIYEQKEAVAPFGTSFWFRPKALSKLFKINWDYKDFPPEPNNVDGTILHGIERIYPFVSQDAGYFPATVQTDEYAENEMTTMLTYVRTYNRLLAQKGALHNFSRSANELKNEFVPKYDYLMKCKEVKNLIRYWQEYAKELERKETIIKKLQKEIELRSRDMVLDKNPNRLTIYFIYDKDGIVDDYIIYAIKEMKSVSKEVIAIVNGKLQPESRVKLSNAADIIYIRENKGYDVWAYKYAIENYGWDNIVKFDELILMNFTIMGPVFPITEMFDKMDKKDVDFWGLSKFHEYKDGDPFGTIKYGYIPEHIQSHFIAVRNNMLKSNEFRWYWDNMKEVNSYSEAIGFHEAIFTKTFSDYGYKWDVYADFENNESHHPILCIAKRMIDEKRCPFFKRRSFMQDYTIMMNETAGESTVELYEYLNNHTNYDMNMFWDNILRLENISVLKRNLALNYILPSDKSRDISDILSKRKIALIMHIYYEDQIEYCFNYAKNIPKSADVYVTTNSNENVDKINQVFSKIQCNKLIVRKRENRGRDLSTLLVEFRKEALQYDYVCYVHDKKVRQMEPQTIGAGFAFRCFENTLTSPEFINNILDTFERNPRLGILSPPPPFHSDYYFLLGHEWGPNFENTKKLAKEFGLTVPITRELEPISGLGSMFWFRTEALRQELQREWKYTDFPKEPVPDDGTILHAIERIHGYIAQQARFYPANLFSEKGARIELTSTEYMLRNLNKVIFTNAVGSASYVETCNNLDYTLKNTDIRLTNLKNKMQSHKILYKMAKTLYKILSKIKNMRKKHG